MDNQFSQGYMSYAQPGQQQTQQQQQQPAQQSQGGLGSFGNLTAPQGQQTNSPSQANHPTLPPLQNQQNGSYAQFGSLSYNQPGSQNHTPTTPHTPVTSGMGHQATNAYSHVSPATMAPPQYGQNPYSMTSSMMYPSSTATSMPTSTSSSGLPTIRPMPPGGVGGSMTGLPSLANTQLGQSPAFMQNEEAPTHVVGSQGRRGILPSAPGRPNAPVTGTGTGQTTKNMIPQKDADGKYPCPHCNKTYLHAKHLKRHLLRHTGDRPYSCHLCKDTFSRSDILKRHFQKCSIRRGNPTGANHLAHQRRNTNSNRLSISQQEGPIGLAGLNDVAGQNPYQHPGAVSSSPTVNGDMSGRSSRANSLITPTSMSHRNSIAGLGILGSNAPGGDQQMASSGPYQPNSLHQYAMQNHTNGGGLPPGYPYTQQHMNGLYNQQQQQPMSFLGHQSSRFDNSHNNSPYQQLSNGEGSGAQSDWSRVFNANGQDGFIGGGLTANASSNGLSNIKTEQDTKPFNDTSNDSFLGSLYSHPGGFGGDDGENEHGIPGFPNWSLDDPLQAKVDSLMQYCFPDGGEPVASDPSTAEMMRMCLSVENVKHFAEHYTSYHGHWPIIHMPTFKLADAGNALVLVIICIGAIYSPKMNVNQSRQMMDFVRATIFKNSNVYQQVTSGQNQDLGNNSWDMDDLQSFLILSTMFTWHGSPEQRNTACNDLPVVVRVVRAMGLLQPAPPGHYAYSVLHHSQSRTLSADEWTSWNWHGWLEQEKRSRAVYHMFLCDAAMGMFFNSSPQLDPLEIRLPLPSDDAAWDAKDDQECANALGMNGPEAQVKNITGTRNARQPGMRESMRTLMELNANFQPGATNVYSKFVLIHALITRIMACQKILFHPEGPFQGFNTLFSNSGPATPVSQNEWLDQNGSAGAGNSGHGTPTDGFGPTIQNIQATQEKKRLNYALDKWKRMWDTDMEIQYPPSKTQLRRFGFSRDGVHFFYLGRSFIQSNRPGDWTAQPDLRFKQVMGLLKRIKQFVIGDPSHYGHDIGSVGDIDDQYGVDNLTLDMKLLFKPYDSMLHSAVPGVQTHSL